MLMRLVKRCSTKHLKKIRKIKNGIAVAGYVIICLKMPLIPFRPPMWWKLCGARIASFEDIFNYVLLARERCHTQMAIAVMAKGEPTMLLTDTEALIFSAKTLCGMTWPEIGEKAGIRPSNAINALRGKQVNDSFVRIAEALGFDVEIRLVVRK